MKIHELQEKRAALIADSRKLLDAADAEGRSILSAEEQERFDAMDAEIRGLAKTIEQRKFIESEEAVAAKIEVAAEVEAREITRDSDEYRSAFFKVLGGERLTDADYRALSIGTNSAGGFLATTTVEQEIVELRQEANWMRGACTTMSVSNQTAFAVESDVGTAAYEAENATVNDDDHAFAQVSFFPNRLGRIMKLSRQLMRFGGTLSEAQLSSYVSSSFAKVFAAEYLEQMLVGSGSANNPTGIMNVASSQEAVTTATGNVATYTADNLIDLFYSLPMQYRSAPKAAWIFSPEALKILRQLKDSDGRYLISAPGGDSYTESLMGKPIYESDFVAAPAADTNIVGFGDLSYYRIVDFGGFEFSVLNELFAANDQIGVKAIAYNDAKQTLAASFKTLKTAAS